MGDGTGAAASATFSNAIVLVAILTGICLLVWVGFAAFVPNPTSSQSALIEGVSHGFSGGFGALIGLLGGKLA
jgi:hypothetical protein